MLGWEMRSWNKAAGILTIFGLTGLILSPFILTPAVSAPAPEGRIVAIAIAAGPHLKLLSSNRTADTSDQTRASDQAMLCGRVFRLAFADIGFSCTGQGPTGAAVAMNPTVSENAESSRPPSFSVAGN